MLLRGIAEWNHPKLDWLFLERYLDFRRRSSAGKPSFETWGV